MRHRREMSFLLDGSPVDPSNEPLIGAAVRDHFARLAKLCRRTLRRFLRRGLITLAIGVVFLTAFFGVSQLVDTFLGNGPVSTLLHEGSVIVGWVAMWRPIEIFLYDWWPLAGERRLYDRLSRIGVRVVAG